jgi:hypothetical protein
MIYKYLSEGIDVDTLSINLKNNETQVNAETSARMFLLAIFKDASNKGILPGKIINSHNFNFDEVPGNGGFLVSQPPLWLGIASFFFQKSEHSGIALGHVAEDDVWHFRTEIVNLAAALNSIRYPEDKFEILWPLEWKHKYEIINDLRATELGDKLLSFISYCCLGTRCGECVSCIKHKNSELLADLNKPKSVIECRQIPLFYL